MNVQATHAMIMPAVLTMKVLLFVSVTVAFLEMDCQIVQVSIKTYEISLGNISSSISMSFSFCLPLSDIDECLRISCHDNAECFDSHGSYICRCKTGFSGNGTFCDSKQ
jgi:hypothetical protein